MTDKSTFVLKLSGIDLSNITAGDIGRLLNDFCKLLGDDHLYFDDIYSGSAVLKIKTNSEYYNEKLQILNEKINSNHNALEDLHVVIRRYSNNFPRINANILASRNACNDEDLEVIHELDFKKIQTHVFEQNEIFIGRLLKPAHGKDKTDHFTILLENDTTLSVEVSKDLSYNIATHLESLWKHKSLIKFSGKAKYEWKARYQLILKHFRASDFEIIKDDTTAKSWIKQFEKLGKSGWQDLEDPIKTWLEERH